MSEIIRVEKLKKFYKKGFVPRKVLALQDTSFVVKKGRITGFIGANGAGKTTTLRCILNFTGIDGGRFYFFGEEGFRMTARRKIGYLPEHPHFYNFLTGYEFLKFYSDLSDRKASHQEILKALADVKLEHAAHRALGGYSKGMLQRVGLAQAMIHRPELLILDEPMSGLDPDGRKLVRDILRDVSQKGVSLFFSTHLLDDAENLCDDLVLMSEGKVVYNGALSDALETGSNEFELSYISQDGAVQWTNPSSQEALHLEVTRVIQEGGLIRDVRPKRKKLEDVFSDLTRREAQ